MVNELKYTALKVDEIEQTKKLPIENIIADNTINNMALLISKGSDTSRNVALSKIDEYLKEKDKDELMFDIIEALVRDGFLSRTLDISKMRELKAKRGTQVQEQIDNM